MQGRSNRPMPAFRAQKTQKGWEPSSFSQSHANEFPTRNVNSRQQRLRHTVIMVDSICEAWVPPPNFLLFVSGSGRGTQSTPSSYCLHWEPRLPSSPGRLWRAAGPREGDAPRTEARFWVNSTVCRALNSASALAHNHSTRSLPGRGQVARGGLDPAGHIRIKVAPGILC